MRLFVAIYPPAFAGDDLERHLSSLALPSPTRRETWHLTLAFLGEVPDDRAGDAAEAVRLAAARTLAPELSLAGGGLFGSVLWCGVDGQRVLLDRLAQRLRQELRHHRLSYDRRPFHPHLTVARPRDRAGRSTVPAELAAYRGPSWRATSVDLVRSRPGPRPVHDTLASAAMRMSASGD